jgi:hypothetical protein
MRQDHTAARVHGDERLSRELQHGRDVFRLEIGMVDKDLFSRGAGRQEIEHVLHANSKTSNARTSAAYAGIHRDSVDCAHPDSAGLCPTGRLSETTAPPALDFVGQCLHRPFANLSACTARKGRLGLVQHHQDFEPLAFTLLPERQRFLNGVFLAADPAAFDRLR